MARVVAALTLVSQAAGLAIELTDKNFKQSVDGKNALLWFHAPW